VYRSGITHLESRRRMLHETGFRYGFMGGEESDDDEIQGKISLLNSKILWYKE